MTDDHPYSKATYLTMDFKWDVRAPAPPELAPLRAAFMADEPLSMVIGAETVCFRISEVSQDISGPDSRVLLRMERVEP